MNLIAIALSLAAFYVALKTRRSMATAAERVTALAGRFNSIATKLVADIGSEVAQQRL